ncbi:hypothetical protein FB446DRAFT_706094 [Lentinula raphanica]|nr:hypothetical protein FB446DRAFT_706094 [Lentinula raphanica]
METSKSPAIDASPVYHPCFFIPGPHVEKLPVELLIEIFVLCAAEDSDAPLTLGTVCSTWKDIVDGSPRVWQVVILDDSEKSLATSQSRAKIWISRSAPLQFDLKLNVAEAINILSPLAPFLPVIDRWRQLTITGACAKKFVCLISINDDDADDHINTGPMFSRRSQFTLPTHFTLPRPRRQHLDMNMICLTHSPQASRSPLAPLRFTSLSITDEYRFERDIHPLNSIAILSLLRTCPHLESFTFHGSMYPLGSQTLPVTVSLLNLHTMNIYHSRQTRVMLSKLYAPALSELYLVDLNVYECDSTFLQEPDDIEDDADDYLEWCRWSNRATGMGFRKLIAQCNPPLKTLIMSYSDMRLKDFIYVFDHLTELEDFRLTNSVMSDTFINLLEPYAAESTSESTRPLHSLNVRLPRLRHLEIRECLGISGDSIVETLLQRVAFTDQLAYTLEQVIISECDQFGVQHQDRLNRELGPRFISHLL